MTSEFRADLLASGLLLESGVDGLYIRSGQYEMIVRAIGDLVSKAGADQNAQALAVAPVIPKHVLEKSGYVHSFPDLLGSVSIFEGDESTHAKILGHLERGENWAAELVAADLTLCSAACHSVYPICTGGLVTGGRRFEVVGYCFRHEPSLDPARMQSFRMQEFVYVGEPDNAVAHRQLWLERTTELLSEIGLVVSTVVANDPFFGRGGRMLASSQRADELKYEIVCAIGSATVPTAVASANYHLDHFGTQFGIESSAGDVAHSACAGFGLERIALALLARHGLNPDSWPATVRSRLWP